MRGPGSAGSGARSVLITGGAGFVGSNLAERLLSRPGTQVRVLDNLSRRGVEHNLEWLRGLPGGRERLQFVDADVRDADAISAAARDADEIYHLAAQVAVTTSVDDPRDDLMTNVVGTFNVLEAARRWGRKPFLLFTSTNKVYGSLHGVATRVEGTRYVAVDPAFEGVTEGEPLDFHSPYGCSKGAADQYVHDYARIYDLPTCVFRMSCIAGPRQFGTEDQGWVAHFLYSVLEGRPLTIYGDGFQVRDVLHVHDLADAMEAARDSRQQVAGNVYNLGGGPARAVSVVEMLRAIAELTGRIPVLHYSATRPGDQPLYISNTARLTTDTGWQARYSAAETLRAIERFWYAHRALLDGQRGRGATAAAVPEMVAEEVA